MNILLTNDDGIGSTGLETLRLELSDEHNLCVVAPDRERSGVSHAVTLREDVVFRDLGGGAYSCSGTPADCVLYSLLGAVDMVPDMVISGINHGPNLGTDLIFSGTAAAARQAALMKVPGIAVSLVAEDNDADFRPAAFFISQTLSFLSSLWDEEHFINVNVPVSFTGNRDFTVSQPSERVYADKLVKREGHAGERAYALTPGDTQSTGIGGGNTDWNVVHSGRVSISPILLRPLNHSGKEAYYTRMAADSAQRTEAE